ncbi:PIR Superfamily Protein [Plasmodium ovale wallikeri]|uniref:Plasmodium vivax Vir protein, putative n=2 Tax=Plasmodium ovale TaxID=36330 RepID=A0A1C3KKN7_PLAOA|nr:PIR Superfamily Protein [Plasmodium ovale wallikeri]SBT74444.1 Plasmodium vivax Vir protein, putative [Plasmodium ovale]
MEGASSQGRPRRLSETSSIYLTSKYIYNLMETNYSDLSEYNEKCDNIVVPDNQKDKVKTICKKFLRYLEKSPLWNVSDPGYDVCLLLNFWVYDKLNHIFRDKDKRNIAFANFQTFFRDNIEKPTSKSRNSKCTDKFEILSKDDWEKRKELYDYYIDYDTNKSTFNFFGEQCKEYYEYIEGKKELYKHFGRLCISNSSECPDFYNDCMKYNPDLVLPKMSCHVKMVAAKNALATHETSDQGMQDGPHPYGSDLSGHSARSSEAGMIQENSDIGTKVGKSVLGIAPIALTASALYRFTPLGQWIRKLAGSNHNIAGNGFGDEAQESGNMFFDGGENYISYQPM